jgi:hypothetical protein
MSDHRVLVAGTTPDYIAYIYEQYPGRALFLTDSATRAGSLEAAPDETSEIVCDLSDKNGVLNALHKHLEEHGQSLSGVACYDCEWLCLAAELAVHYGLSFPSVESVRRSRDKFLTKSRWESHGVRCPKAELVYSGWQTLHLIKRFGRSVVLKPTTGAGSELTFRCHDNYDLSVAFRAIQDGLLLRSRLPLYKPFLSGVTQSVLGQPVLAEEFVEGREYSADFIIDGDDLQIIRVAKKLGGGDLPFGTTTAYVVPAKLPGWLNHEMLSETLHKAATALGFDRAICMIDFIISKDEVFLLELSPRIGGDCLPPLIRKSCGLDTIGLALDFAEGLKYEIPSPDRWKELVGMRLFSLCSGLLVNVNCKALSEDTRVKEIFIKREPGHEITMPPEDYDSWLLGHVIFEPESDVSLRKQCVEIEEKISMNVEPYYDQKLTWFLGEGSRDPERPSPQA